MRTVESRGTITVAVDRCKGCELCIPACPPQVLRMSTDRNELGVPYPEPLPGRKGRGACPLVRPEFRLETYQYETPVEYEVNV